MDWFVIAIVAAVVCLLIFINKKKRNDREFLKEIVSAAAEGESRAQVNRALGSVGVEFDAEPDNAQFCIKASAAVVELIMKRAGKDPKSATSDDIFTGGVFGVVASNHLTRLVGAQFETVSSIVPLELFGLEAASDVPEIINAYNRITQEGRIAEAIGQNIALWIAEPSDERLDKLAKLYKLCNDSIN